MLGILQKKIFWQLVFWSGVIAVCAASLAPLLRSPLTGPGNPLPGVTDKFQHVAAYFVLMAVSYPAYRELRFELRIAAGLTALGLALEMAQLWQPPREVSFADAAANAAGVVLAIPAARRALKIWRRYEFG